MKELDLLASKIPYGELKLSTQPVEFILEVVEYVDAYFKIREGLNLQLDGATPKEVIKYSEKLYNNQNNANRTLVKNADLKLEKEELEKFLGDILDHFELLPNDIKSLLEEEKLGKLLNKKIDDLESYYGCPVCGAEPGCNIDCPRCMRKK